MARTKGRRPGGRLPHLPAGLVVAATAFACLTALRSEAALHPPYPRSDAARAALRDDRVRDFLEEQQYTSVRVLALDDSHWRVTFMRGPKAVMDAAVDERGAVDAVQLRGPETLPPGSRILWSPACILALAALFVLALAVRPLRNGRNMDLILITGGVAAAMLLFRSGLVTAPTVVGAATMAYAAARCAWVGMRGTPSSPAMTPLYRSLAGRADPRRVLLIVLAGVLVFGEILTLTSTNVADIGFAGLAGATQLNGGQLPYGRLTTDVVHGDTYPLLTYVLYMPFAAFAPVRDVFDGVEGALALNAIAIAAGAALMSVLPRRLAGGTGGAETALVPALAWLAFPPVLLAASGGGNDVPTAVFVIAALALFHRPVLSTAMLMLAAWTKAAPVVAMAVWIPRLRGAQLRGAITAAAVAVGAGAGGLIAIDGASGIRDALDAMRFQFERGSWYSVWQYAGGRAAQTAFQAATLGFIAFVALEAARAGSKMGLRRTAALCAAVLLLLQIGANHWTFSYLPWVLPLLLVALFQPVVPRDQPAPPRSPRPAPSAP